LPPCSFYHLYLRQTFIRGICGIVSAYTDYSISGHSVA